jgi:hypothetical protein
MGTIKNASQIFISLILLLSDFSLAGVKESKGTQKFKPTSEKNVRVFVQPWKGGFTSTPDLIILSLDGRKRGTIDIQIKSGVTDFKDDLVPLTSISIKGRPNYEYLMADFDEDGISDLLVVDKMPSNSANVTMRVFAGKSNFKEMSSLLELPLCRSNDYSFLASSATTVESKEFKGDSYNEATISTPVTIAGIKYHQTKSQKVEVFAIGFSKQKVVDVENAVTNLPTSSTKQSIFRIDYDGDNYPELAIAKEPFLQVKGRNIAAKNDGNNAKDCIVNVYHFGEFNTAIYSGSGKQFTDEVAKTVPVDVTSVVSSCLSAVLSTGVLVTGTLVAPGAGAAFYLKSGVAVLGIATAYIACYKGIQQMQKNHDAVVARDARIAERARAANEARARAQAQAHAGKESGGHGGDRSNDSRGSNPGSDRAEHVTVDRVERFERLERPERPEPRERVIP